jgi:PAS domain S-box-containing protein
MKVRARVPLARSRIWVYALVFVATAWAIAIRGVLDPLLGDYLPFVTLYAAIAFAVWLGGYRPAVLAGVLGLLACDFLFIEPRRSLAIAEVRAWIDLVAYLTVGAVIIFVGEASRVALDRLEKANRTQRALHQFLDRLQHAASLPEIYESAIATILEALACERASISTFDDEGVMRFREWHGLSESYRRATEGHSPWKPDETEARPLAVGDVRTAELDGDLRRVVQKEGIGALCFLPLSVNGKLIGRLTTYFNAPHVFTEAELELSETIGRELAFGIERKLAEQELRDNEERMRLATRTGKIGIWDWDLVTDRISWTDSLFQIHGIQKKDFDGTSRGFSKLVHPEDRDLVERAMLRALAGEALYELEFRVVRADGQVAWVFTNAAVLHGGGKAVRMLGATADITASKQVQAALRESEARFEAEATALARLNDASSRLWRTRELTEGLGEILDATIELLGADKGGLQILDPERQILRLAAQRGFEGDYLDSFREVSAEEFSACSRTLSTGERTVVEDVETDAAFAPFRSAARAGGFRAVQSTPLTGRDGRILGVLSTHFSQPHRPSEQELRRVDLYARQAADFIERSGVEDALRTRTEELETLLDLIPVPVWIASDRDCREVRGNRAASELLAASPAAAESEEAAPMSLLALKHFRDSRPLAPEDYPMRQAATTGQTQEEAELELELPNGRRVVVAGGAAPLRASDGQVRGVISAFADITELKRKEEAVNQSSRAKDEFLAILSHELRNPIAAITNAAALLRRRNAPRSSSEIAKDIIERQSAHLTRLIDDLLDVSRITRGKMGFVKRLASIEEVIALASDTVHPALEERRQSLVVSARPGVAWVIADINRLSQAIGNVLHNASKYSPEGARIWLAVEVEGSHVVVRVRDEGTGIPADLISRIFDPFVQGDFENETLPDRARRGLGLGLTLAKSILEHCGGTIEPASAGPGQGSVFAIRIPAVAPEDRDAPAVIPTAGETVGAGAPQRILIVEDNVDSARGLADLLELDGHNVQALHDGESALLAAPAFRPDIILLDIGLPGIDGYETARRLRAMPALSSVYFVALTGYGQEEDRRKAQEAGFDLHVVKPIRAEALMRLLSTHRRAPAARPRSALFRSAGEAPVV